MIGYAAIVAAVVVWAMSYIVMKSTTADYPQLLFQFWRYAAVALLYCVLFRHSIRKITRAVWKIGLFKLGLANFVLGFFSIHAVQYTAPTRVVVINSLIVGFVPLLRWMHERSKPALGEKWAIGIALAAIALLLGPQNGEILTGDVLAFIGMLGFAYTIIHTNRLLATGGSTVVQASFLSVAGSAVYFALAALVYACFNPLGLGLNALFAQPETLAGILYMVFFVSLGASLLQAVGQRRLSPVTVSILFCLEPAMTAVFDYSLLGNRLPLNVLFSGALLVVASLLAMLPADAGMRARRTGRKSRHNNESQHNA